MLRNDECSNWPEGAGEQAVGDSHDGNRHVGVEERECEQDVAEEGDGDGGEHVRDVQARLVDEEAQQRRGRRRNQINETWKEKSIKN